MIVYKGDVLFKTRPKKENNSVIIKGLDVDFKDIDVYLDQKQKADGAHKKNVSLNYPQLREWDLNLLSYFKPFYAPLCDMCCMCTYGKCDLSNNKKGACGINLEKQQSRIALLTACIGASTHAAHARDLTDELLEENPDMELKYSNSIDLTSPIITTLTGITPRTANELDEVMSCVEKELTNLMASAHTGQEGAHLDFESKALHAGILDHLALEIAEIAQINLYDLDKGEPDTPLLEIGMGVVDSEKPVILCIGHNIAPSSKIIDYADKIELLEDIEICGLCCTAIEQQRYSPGSKIVGSISRQLMFIRAGIPDVVVLDEQCIRADILELCAERNIPIIATSDKCSLGLPDRTRESPQKIVSEIMNGDSPGVLIRDVDQVGKVAVDLALKVKARSLLNEKSLQEEKDLESIIHDCVECGQCERVCLAMLPITASLSEAKNGDTSLLASFYGNCVGCGKCMEACPEDIPVIDLIRMAAEEKIASEKYLIRSGRGPVQDVEIRKVGAPIVFGDIPGIIALAACSNYDKGEEEIALIAEEYLKRGYIVVAAGCAAMDIALYKDEEGKTLYEKYPGDFDKGGLLNLGPCVANAHAIGSAIKIANIFAKVPLENNFTEVADYIVNRIGVCVIAWGAMSQKAFAIATGANRWGIPAIIGPQASKYRRLYLGDDLEPRNIKDQRDQSEVMCEPAPLHLAYSAESINECMTLAAKLCIRPNDTPRGRMIKLSNYIDLYKKYYGTLPSDLHLYIRDEKEIPFKEKDEILKKLKEMNWEPRKSPQEPSICMG